MALSLTSIGDVPLCSLGILHQLTYIIEMCIYIYIYICMYVYIYIYTLPAPDPSTPERPTGMSSSCSLDAGYMFRLCCYVCLIFMLYICLLLFKVMFIDAGYVYIYIYICMYVCVYLYTCVCVYIHIYIYIHMYVYMYIYIYIYMIIIFGVWEIYTSKAPW